MSDSVRDAGAEERDLLVAAAELVIGAQKVSYSALQRRLRLNFARAVGVACALEGLGVVSPPDSGRSTGRRLVLLADFDRAAITHLADMHLGLALCCDLHNQHCEPPSELCCRYCTERAHDTFPTPHADGSRCVLNTAEAGRRRHSLDDLGDVKVRFWVCPVKAHRDRNDARGWPVVTVEWEGDVARCTAEGCARTSADGREETT